MANTLEIMELLARDLKIVANIVLPTPLENIQSMLEPKESWNLNPESMSEHAYFNKLIEVRLEALKISQLRKRGGVWEACKLVDELRSRFLPLPVFKDPPCSIRQSASDRFPREAWFFVNGIATDKEVLKLNGAYLSKLFMRPIELIYNPTQGPFADLIECITGRTFDYVSLPAAYALERISMALSNPEKDRVVLMGHSQGGIIVSNAVAGLIERFGGDEKRLSKLEVYTFASACDHMQVDRELDTQQRHVPYIEHFANTGDLVAKLGVLEKQLPIHGRVYTLDKKGHFLNASYLPEIEARRYAWRDESGDSHCDARLYGYLKGDEPELLPI